MAKFNQGLAWVRDVAQVLVLDRFHPARKRTAEIASTACRALRFHTRAKIRPLPWAEIFQKLSVAPVAQVTLPGPDTELGDVGGPDGYHALAALAQALQPKTVFEFGTYLGVSACTLAMNTPPDCRIYTMDLPDPAVATAVPKLNEIDQRHIVRSRFRVGEAFLRTPFKDRIVQLRENSLSFRAETCVANIDLVYVDGGHSLPLVTQDTENAFRMLSASGTILWDDYFHLYPDVVAFLDQLAGQYPLFAIPGTNFVLYSRRWHAPALGPALTSS